MSKLIVEICTIDKIEAIPNADKITLATVKGWACIIGKDTFKEGDVCIFVPPDAILPEKLIEEQKLEFLKGNGRVRTIKLRNTISQGLVLPLSVLKGHTVKVGDDVAKILGIKKYEPEVKSISRPKETLTSLWIKLISKEITLRRFVAKSVGIIYDRNFKPKKNSTPGFVKYTDIENIKNYNKVFIDGEFVIITEKVHGSNARFGTLKPKQSIFQEIFHIQPKYRFAYGSHNVEKSCMVGDGFYGEDVWGTVAKKYNLANKIPNDYIVYGEVYGANKPGRPIQELTYGEDSVALAVFDVKYKDKYLNWDEFEKFCVERNLPIVPILYRGPFSEEVLKANTEGRTTFKAGHIREGCVVKPLIEVYDNTCGRKILKSISTAYLLTKKKDTPEEFIDDNAEMPH